MGQIFVEHLEYYDLCHNHSSPNLGDLCVAHGLLPMMIKLAVRRQKCGTAFTPFSNASVWLMPLMTNAQAEAIFVTIRRIMASNLDSIVRIPACTCMANGLLRLALGDRRLAGCMRRAGFDEPFDVPAFGIFENQSKWSLYDAIDPIFSVYQALRQLARSV